MNEKEIYKIVLTGGPCAGKTTALTKLEEFLTEHGFHVMVVSESATELIKGGARPFGKGKIDMTEFQTVMLDYQHSKEMIYDKAANLSESDKIVILFDRGINDNKAYINQEIFTRLINDLGLDELELMDNYDMVIHLVTAAKGAKEFYTLENNNARTETVEQAIELDTKTLNAWAGHPNLTIIGNETDFKEKMQRVLEEVCKLVKLKKDIKHQRKFLIDPMTLDLSFLTKDNSTIVDIEQSYLDCEEGYAKRLRKRCMEGATTYYLSSSKSRIDGKEIITDKKISVKDYERILSSYKVNSTVNKRRYSFAYENEYYTLDIFNEGLVILEVNSENKELKFPPFLKVIEEVTGRMEYSNEKLGVKHLTLQK